MLFAWKLKACLLVVSSNQNEGTFHTFSNEIDGFWCGFSINLKSFWIKLCIFNKSIRSQNMFLLVMSFIHDFQNKLSMNYFMTGQGEKKRFQLTQKLNLKHYFLKQNTTANKTKSNPNTSSVKRTRITSPRYLIENLKFNLFSTRFLRREDSHFSLN